MGNQKDGERSFAYADLGDFIRAERLRRNLSQERLAALAGVSRAQLVLLEKGENVSLAFLEKVARVLELDTIHVKFLTLRARTPLSDALLHAAQALDEARATLRAIPTSPAGSTRPRRGSSRS